MLAPFPRCKQCSTGWQFLAKCILAFNKYLISIVTGKDRSRFTVVHMDNIMTTNKYKNKHLCFLYSQLYKCAVVLLLPYLVCASHSCCPIKDEYPRVFYRQENYLLEFMLKVL